MTMKISCHTVERKLKILIWKEKSNTNASVIFILEKKGNYYNNITQCVVDETVLVQ